MLETYLPPTVSINGNAIRQIREEKKLTQLYVAKVVGVTTDTISRWENNRYPSIKRENVLRLAEALEVDVACILPATDESGTVTEEGSSPVEESKRSWLVPLMLLTVVLLGAALIYFSRETPELQTLAERHLPHFAAPGSIVPVWIDVDQGLAGTGFIIRERFPSGWKLIEANPPASSLDNIDGVARWIIKPGEERVKVAYLLRVASDAPMRHRAVFSGEGVAKNDGQSTPARVGGTLDAEVAPNIWADTNGDNKIDDNEMLQASDVIDEMHGVHIDWGLLEKIWDAGHYSWIEEKSLFQPERELTEIKTH